MREHAQRELFLAVSREENSRLPQGISLSYIFFIHVEINWNFISGIFPILEFQQTSSGVQQYNELTPERDCKNQ